MPFACFKVYILPAKWHHFCLPFFFSWTHLYSLFSPASFKLPVCPCVWLWQAYLFDLQEPQFSSSIKGTRGCVLVASQICVWGYHMQLCMKWLEDGDKLLKYQQVVLLWEIPTPLWSSFLKNLPNIQRRHSLQGNFCNSPVMKKPLSWHLGSFLSQ